MPEDSPAGHARIGLSKSRISLFEQCPKRLWLSVHRPDLADETAATRAGFAAGHAIGDLACGLHPDGRMIEVHTGLADAVAATEHLLKDGWDRPIFEATFAYDGVLVRADLMLPVAGGWHVAEVKASTGVKAYHIADVATQLWVMLANRVPIVSASIRHLDRDFVLTRERNYAGLFTDSFIEDAVAPLVANRGDIIAGARATLMGDEPVREVGTHCDAPFACSFKSWCGRNQPPQPDWPVNLLPDASGKALAQTLAANGIEDLREVAADAMPSPKLQRIHAATVSGQPYHDRESVRADTASWHYPRIFLDFETIQFAIPRWLGTRPYQQIPFQFSAHVEWADGQTDHHAFLATDGSDPRRACAEALLALPTDGAIVTWNASFERGQVQALATAFPDLADRLSAFAKRIVDLLPVVRRHYYHRDMRGSWSLKAVLPTLAAELGYDGLVDVRSGIDAQLAYLEAVDPATPTDREAEIRTALLAYCGRDTEAMMTVLNQLCAASPRA